MLRIFFGATGALCVASLALAPAMADVENDTSRRSRYGAAPGGAASQDDPGCAAGARYVSTPGHKSVDQSRRSGQPAPAEEDAKGAEGSTSPAEPKKQKPWLPGNFRQKSEGSTPAANAEGDGPSPGCAGDKAAPNDPPPDDVKEEGVN